MIPNRVVSVLSSLFRVKFMSYTCCAGVPCSDCLAEENCNAMPCRAMRHNAWARQCKAGGVQLLRCRHRGVVLAQTKQCSWMIKLSTTAGG